MLTFDNRSRQISEFADGVHSGVGRENHKMMLDHYSQTKCLLVSYDKNPMGFF